MDAFALLRLQIEWGADDALDDDPVDRLREVARPAPAAARATAASPTAPGIIQARPAAPADDTPKATPAERALAAAAQAATLEDLRAAIAAFDGCALRETAGHLVFAEGDPAAGLLVIGEAPGADEDRTGHAFAGRTGALLDKMLASIHLTRDQMLLTPLIPWRPPGGRPPNAGEIAVCRPFLNRLITLTQPGRLLLFGTQTAQTLLPPQARRRRGGPDWVDCAIPGLPAPIPALALPGLSALLKNPLEKREAWAGLRRLRQALDGL